VAKGTSDLIVVSFKEASLLENLVTLHGNRS
jgi:hypothetical protein